MRTILFLIGAAALALPAMAQDSPPSQDGGTGPVELCPSEELEPGLAEQEERSIEVTILHTAERANLLRYDLSDGLIYAEVLVNGQAVRGIFDTGADNTIVDTGLIERLGGSLTGPRSRGHTGLNTFDVSRACETTFTIPGQITLTGDLPATDLSGLSERLGRQVGVIIGRNLLGRMTWVVNPKDSSGILAIGTMTFNGGEPDSVAIEDGRIEATVNGKPATLLFDTGFNGTLALRAERWDDYVPAEAEIGTQRAADGTGTVYEKRATSGVSLSVGGVTVDAEASEGKLAQEGVDGLLGYGFFRNATMVHVPTEDILYFSMRKDESADAD